MKKEEEKPALTVNELIEDSLSFFGRTLEGIGREDYFKINIVHAINNEGAHVYTISTSGLPLEATAARDLDYEFESERQAAEYLALCACHFVLHQAEIQLSTRPDEQGFMTRPMAYWFELKREALTYISTHLKHHELA